MVEVQALLQVAQSRAFRALAALVSIGLVWSLVLAAQRAAARAEALHCGVRFRQVLYAIDGFYVDTGVLPQTLAALSVQESAQPGWSGPYLQAADLIDPWGSPWIYQPRSDDGVPYSLLVAGNPPCDSRLPKS
ncbi:MAG: type II secretion system protein GspG [Anaerolineae bacterium]|nr:type II secretion system protein GspG [Anaerolineae bacterium]